MRVTAPALQQLRNAGDGLPLALRWALESAAVGDLRAYGHLIQCCADSGLLREGRQLHARLVLRLAAAPPSNFLASKLISLYSRCGRLDDARRLFDDIPRKNLFAWNSMLIAYALHDRPADAFRLFSSLPRDLRPDAFTLSSVLKSLLSVPSSSLPRSVQEYLHAFALQLGFDSDLFICNGLIAVYAHTNKVTSARKLFDGMLERDTISWNSMISAYSQCGHYEECLQLYQEMTKGADGMMPNAVTAVSVFQACSHLKDLAFGMEVHRFIVEIGIEVDTVVWNSIIGFYAKCGSLDYARGLFEQMSGKDAVSYSTMITGYMSYGFVSQAMELFRQLENPVLSTWNAVVAGLMQNNHHEDIPNLISEMQASGFQPNSVTLSCLLPALSFFSNLLGGKEVHAYAIRKDFDQNIYVATALIDVYAKAGFLEGAGRVFELTRVRNVIVWTSIISSYAAHGDADATFSSFYHMLECGTKPDAVTFTALLTACAHAGEVEKAHQIFDAMLSEYGIAPGAEHYACMVGVLSRSGMLKEAADLIEKMPFEPNAKAWGSLLNGAAVHGDADIGQLAFQQLFEIEPQNTGNYIVMANLLSKTGKWEDAEMVRDKMKAIGLTKFPGCSWIETCDGLQVFVARDTLHRRCKEIYLVLEQLLSLMREEGYCFVEELHEESNVYGSQSENKLKEDEQTEDKPHSVLAVAGV